MIKKGFNVVLWEYLCPIGGSPLEVLTVDDDSQG